ncbi:hypothetical protein BGZ67_010019 [Mortierella alpina]|nr:hypothetical protein BGZ67_010019 [Mortierella alpina]
MIAPVQNQLSYVLITALDLIRQLRSTSWLLDPSVKLLKFTGRGPKRQIGICKSMLTHIGIGLTLGTLLNRIGISPAQDEQLDEYTEWTDAWIDELSVSFTILFGRGGSAGCIIYLPKERRTFQSLHAAAYGFWHKIVLSNRSQREQFYVKYNAVKA